MPKPSGPLLTIIVVPVVLLMLGAASTALYSARALENSRILINETNAIIDNSAQLLTLSEDAETSQRGFVITGNEAYLAPYNNAQVELPRIMADLQSQLADNPSQLERLQTLSGYLAVKQVELAETIETRRSKGFAAAQAIVLDNRGQAAMESIRSLVNDIRVAEKTLLEQHLTMARQAEQQTFVVTAVLLLILMLVLCGGGLVFWRNFSRLAEAERELAIKAQLLQMTLETVGDGIAAFNADRKLVAFNQRFFDLFGFKVAMASQGSALTDLIEADRENGGTFASVLSLPASDLKPAIGTFEQRDGRVLEVYRSLMPGGGSLLACRDVTETRQGENRLRQAQKMETIGQLTGGVAHDFNNLLQIIMANIDLVMRRITDEEQRKRLQSALVGAERGSKLTRQLLAFARRQPLRPEPVNLSRVVRDLTDLLRRTLGESIEIEETGAAGLWSALADRGQVENAILNLAINARDAMPQGGRLTIELGNAFLDNEYARNHEDVKPGQYVMIAVSDTGIGMSKEVMERAFDPFFSTKPEGRGTGLGLSMVYGFLKQSGGHAKIYSEPGHGTTIRLYLPRSLQGEPLPYTGGESVAAGQGEMILVVEDDDDVRSAVVSMIRDLGYNTIEASNGQETLEILKQDTPIHLMFSDVVMPGELHGRRLGQEAQAIRPGLDIIFTSGYTENSIIHNGRLDDGVQLLSKPYRKEDLARKFREVLDKTAPLSPPAEPAEEMSSAEVPSTNRLKVVFAEDDALVRIATIDMLEDMGFEIFPAADFSAAIALIQSEKPGILMVDVSLGSADGRKLAEDARKLMPELNIIFATGRDPGDLLTRIPNARVVSKPYGMPELRTVFAGFDT
jgi:signal transduction histidine kinase/DNA-binding response OmpR family regulator